MSDFKEVKRTRKPIPDVTGTIRIAHNEPIPKGWEITGLLECGDWIAEPVKECPVTKGTKHDDGKPALDLLDPYAIEQLGLVMACGAKKYGRFNWCKGIAYSRLIAATLRHMMSFLRGENLDPETRLSHVAHAMANCMMLLNMTLVNKEMDDRHARQNKP